MPIRELAREFTPVRFDFAILAVPRSAKARASAITRKAITATA